MNFLIGNTGFVGSNISAQYKFDGLFHSSNVSDAFGKCPDLLVYSGVRAEMFLANKYPDWDRTIIEEAIANIKKISPKEVVLISTVAVYPLTVFVDENSEIDTSLLSPYGQNRLNFEKWIEDNIENHLIVRLPAIYGLNLKKNFLYDCIHIIPNLLTYEKFNELVTKENVLKEYYSDQNNGFFKCRNLNNEEKKILKNLFNKIGFSALNFTDSRSIYQFYNLEHLWNDIEKARKNGVRKINLVPPPISVSEVYNVLYGKGFCNKLNKPPFNYNIKTCHSKIFGYDDGYIMTKEQELNEIITFVKETGE